MEQAIFTKLNRYPRSTTPRERMMMLLVIRVGLGGILSGVLGLVLLNVGGLVHSNPLATAGVILVITCNILLVLGAILLFCLIIIYGD
ncbi:MAG TPA: hypothetical protein VFX24_17345 [Ktedonobacterales bacterium]|nr:hypothetical protein [Ktedonobacterales bacterium]